MMLKILKKINPVLKYLFKRYHSKVRKYRYGAIEVMVHPEVFPPHFTISTKILLDFIKPINLEGAKVLELGCGSGIISLFASSKGALVTASDINHIALEMLEKASSKNKLPVYTLYSNLFDSIKEKQFDYIIINPPYYPKTAKNDREQAWFCGENFEYFEKLFKQLPSHIENTKVFMILSEDCDLKRISNIAFKNKLKLKITLEKTGMLEKNFIYKICK